VKVILRQEVESLGTAGEVVNVKAGYGRNYLIPHQFAYPATKSYLQVYQQEKKLRENKSARELQKARHLAGKLSNLSLEATVQVGEDDKVFGAVTSQDIADLLAAKSYEIDKRDILLDEPIKALGIYNVEIKVAPEVKAEIKVWVIKG